MKSLRGRLAFCLISKLYRQMYANTGIATDSARVSRAERWARMLAPPTRRLFSAPPMPELQGDYSRHTFKKMLEYRISVTLGTGIDFILLVLASACLVLASACLVLASAC